MDLNKTLVILKDKENKRIEMTIPEYLQRLVKQEVALFFENHDAVLTRIRT